MDLSIEPQRIPTNFLGILRRMLLSLNMNSIR